MPPNLDELGSRGVVVGVPDSNDLIPFYDVSELGNASVKKTLVSSIGASADSVQTALAVDPEGAWDALAAGADVLGAGDLVNSQPYCFKKISAWNNSTSAPINIEILGDSFASLGKPFKPGPLMAKKGSRGQGYAYISGSAVIDHTLEYDKWISGSYFEIPVGTVVDLSQGEDAPAYMQASACQIYVIKGPGRGTFDLQRSTNNGAWTNVQTGIDTSNASFVGAVITNALSTSATPSHRLRITNVTGASVYIIGSAVYNEAGGGVVHSRLCAIGNINIQSQIAVPTAIFDPIWSALSPDLVIACWADPAEDWEVGGDFETLYALTQAVKTETDWVVVSGSPVQTPVAPETSTWDLQRAAQRAWAIRENQSWINGASMFISYDVANSKGLMGDATHLSARGIFMRDAYLWSKLPIGYYPLGQVMTPPFPQSGSGAIRQIGNTQLNAIITEIDGPFQTIGSTGGFLLGDRGDVGNGAKIWTIYNSSATIQFFYFGSNRLSLDGNGTITMAGGLIGTPQALSGAGAVNTSSLTTKLTTTGAAQALTLANGTDGQIKTIIHDVDGGSAVLTPTTKTGYTTITFTNAGESATLQYVTTRGWIILSLHGAVAA